MKWLEGWDGGRCEVAVRMGWLEVEATDWWEMWDGSWWGGGMVRGKVVGGVGWWKIECLEG